MLTLGRGQRLPLQFPTAKLRLLTFRPLLAPERDQEARLRDERGTTAVIPDHVVRTPDFFGEWHL